MRLNKIEAMYGKSRVNVKVEPIVAQPLRLRVAFHTLPVFHLRT